MFSEVSASGASELMLVSLMPLPQEAGAYSTLCSEVWRVPVDQVTVRFGSFGEVRLDVADFNAAVKMAAAPQVRVKSTVAGLPDANATLTTYLPPVFLPGLPNYARVGDLAESVNLALASKVPRPGASTAGAGMPTLHSIAMGAVLVPGGIPADSFVAHVELMAYDAAAAVFLRTAEQRRILLDTGRVNVSGECRAGGGGGGGTTMAVRLRRLTHFAGATSAVLCPACLSRHVIVPPSLRAGARHGHHRHPCRCGRRRHGSDLAPSSLCGRRHLLCASHDDSPVPRHAGPLPCGAG
jgi:hypothetical protein